MIIQGKHEAADKALRANVSEMLVRFALCGYMLLGEAIRIRQSSVKTASTDGRAIFYNPEFWVNLAEWEQVFVILHEFLHIYYGHPDRRGDRDPSLWNKACDIFVNMECEKVLSTENETWKTPALAIQPKEWAKDKTVEEIYDILNKMKQNNQLPKDLEEAENDMTDPPLESESDKHEWQDQFRDDAYKASVVNEMAGHEEHMTDNMNSRLERLMQGRIPWGLLLRGAIQEDLGYDVATFAKPNKKTYPRILLPSYRSLKERALLIGVDVSYSVSPELLTQFASNVCNAAERATKTIIVTFDKKIRERYDTHNPRRILDNLTFGTGGHSYTDVREVFEVVDEVKPSAITILTDGYIRLPNKPYRNTLWVIPEHGSRLPWGRTYVMDTQL